MLNIDQTSPAAHINAMNKKLGVIRTIFLGIDLIMPAIKAKDTKLAMVGFLC